MADYNTMELMICTAARELEDGASVGVGTGAPCAAAMLAQKTGSPNLVILFEAGGAAPLIPEMPISVGDSRTTWKAVMASGMCEIMETACRGMLDYTFLGGAQLDMYGNLNSTRIGADQSADSCVGSEPSSVYRRFAPEVAARVTSIEPTNGTDAPASDAGAIVGVVWMRGVPVISRAMTEHRSSGMSGGSATRTPRGYFCTGSTASRSDSRRALETGLARPGTSSMPSAGHSKTWR